MEKKKKKKKHLNFSSIENHFQPKITCGQKQKWPETEENNNMQNIQSTNTCWEAYEELQLWTYFKRKIGKWDLEQLQHSDQTWGEENIVYIRWNNSNS